MLVDRSRQARGLVTEVPEQFALWAYQCCTCNGSGLDGDGLTCRDCTGTGIDNHTDD